MIGLLCFVLTVLASPFKSQLRLQAENAVLRHQLNVVKRRLPGRVRLTNHDLWFLIQLYLWFPSILQVLTIMRPETLVRWHMAGFRGYWRWKSRPLGGRPQIETQLRVLIRRMNVENPLWGAPRIHGELLKLGFEVAQYSLWTPVQFGSNASGLCLHQPSSSAIRCSMRRINDQIGTSPDMFSGARFIMMTTPLPSVLEATASVK